MFFARFRLHAAAVNYKSDYVPFRNSESSKQVLDKVQLARSRGEMGNWTLPYIFLYEDEVYCLYGPLLQQWRAIPLHLSRGLRLVPNMYGLNSLRTFKRKEPVLRVTSRRTACKAFLPILASKAERASAHRHKDQTYRWCAGTDDRQLSFRNAPDE
jgi:hypothetical protein